MTDMLFKECLLIGLRFFLSFYFFRLKQSYILYLSSNLITNDPVQEFSSDRLTLRVNTLEPV